MTVEIKALTEEHLVRALPELARLRISVFRDWPYLYDGTADYEQKYLARYAGIEGAVIVGAYDGDLLVGAATGMPLDEEVPEFRQPFEDAGLNPSGIFYLAESVLAPGYRGTGIGHAFFDKREAHARRFGFERAAFCSVIRPQDHPLRPAGYRSLDPFWTKRGYRPLPDGIVHFPWKDVDRETETEKPLQIWMGLLPGLR
ncbi:GNAT family acetyltransferase [Roseibium aquae]|uniref:GNAT family acetyltransferase n=1 Tax=Roseibium aquae TaxID=1323746 RepID=A0A916WWK3_9HYPH|nr:GNAT family N-acetyltransferase [Roseibium aquae]GGB35625.1 GNAT family acetyltransferase [Roseibium aquae]